MTVRGVYLMKKIFCIVLVIVLLLSGCERTKNNEYIGTNNGIEEKRSIISKINTSDEFYITDNVAIEIGNSVLKSIYGEEIFNDTEYLLTYYKIDKAYIFTRIPKKEGYETLGCPYYEVLISALDGSILGIWQE